MGLQLILRIPNGGLVRLHVRSESNWECEGSAEGPFTRGALVSRSDSGGDGFVRKDPARYRALPETGIQAAAVCHHSDYFADSADRSLSGRNADSSEHAVPAECPPRCTVCRT